MRQGCSLIKLSLNRAANLTKVHDWQVAEKVDALILQFNLNAYDFFSNLLTFDITPCLISCIKRCITMADISKVFNPSEYWIFFMANVS